jgi:hypothetical protein
MGPLALVCLALLYNLRIVSFERVEGTNNQGDLGQ